MIKIDNLINAYSPLYFEYFCGDMPKNLKIKYVSAPNHRWRYEHPVETVKENYKKIQFLFHPFSWSLESRNNISNFANLVSEKHSEMITSIDSEISIFTEEIMRNYK